MALGDNPRAECFDDLNNKITRIYTDNVIGYTSLIAFLGYISTRYNIACICTNIFADKPATGYGFYSIFKCGAADYSIYCTIADTTNGIYYTSYQITTDTLRSWVNVK